MTPPESNPQPETQQASFAATPGSGTFLLHVRVWGEYAGAYEYATLADALKAKEKRESRFSSLGCSYRIESPNNAYETPVS